MRRRTQYNAAALFAGGALALSRPMVMLAEMDSFGQRNEYAVGSGPASAYGGYAVFTVNTGLINGTLTIDGSDTTINTNSGSATTNASNIVSHVNNAANWTAGRKVIAVSSGAQVTFFAATRGASFVVTAAPSGMNLSNGTYIKGPVLFVGSVAAASDVLTITSITAGVIQPGMDLFTLTGGRQARQIQAYGTGGTSGTGGTGTYKLNTTITAGISSTTLILGFLVNPVTSFWQDDYTVNTGRSTWGPAAMACALSQGRIILDDRWGRPVGGSNSGQWVDTTLNPYERLAQALATIDEARAAGCYVDAVYLPYTTNELATTYTNTSTTVSINNYTSLFTSFQAKSVKIISHVINTRGNNTFPQYRIDGTGDNTDCADFTGSISGTVLTAGAPGSGQTIRVGQKVFVGGVYQATITSLGSGSGGAGTYNLDTSLAVASTTMHSGFDKTGIAESLDDWLMNTAPGLFPNTLYPCADFVEVMSALGLPYDQLGNNWDGTLDGFYDGLHPSPYGNSVGYAPSMQSPIASAFPGSLPNILPTSASDPDNWLGADGVMTNGGGGNIIVSGSSPTNTGFSMNGRTTGTQSQAAVPLNWNVATITGWGGTSPNNVTGVVTVTTEAVTYGNGLRIQVACNASGKTNTNTVWLRASIAVTIPNDVAFPAGEEFEAWCKIQASGIAGFRGFSPNLILTEPDGGIRNKYGLFVPPNGTAFMNWDSSFVAQPFIISSPRVIRKAGNYSAAEFQIDFAFGGQEPSVTGDFIISQVYVGPAKK